MQHLLITGLSRILMLGLVLIGTVVCTVAQSTSLDFPTPVTSAQIAGKIKARDIGDSRLTSHYYLFESETGDVLLNIETANLNGDIDVYTAGSMKPLLKASVYSFGYATAMQRQVYLRLPSRLILRIEGRTPNDDPAEYKISFGGVFKAIAASAVPRDPGPPKVSANEIADGAKARVSSVGTIIEEIKPPPPPIEAPKPEVKKETPKTTVAKNTPAKEKPRTPPPTNTRPKPTVPEVVVKPMPPVDPTKRSRKTAEPKKTETNDKPEKPKTEAKKTPATAKNTSPPAKKPPPVKAKPKEPEPDPLASVFLVVNMKDGRKLRYSMADVLRVNVDKGVVTIILKSGDIERLSLLEVAEMKIGQ